MIVFCHLLNDNSGSPVVLKSIIDALSTASDESVLFVGSQGRGCLESAGIPVRRYWYHRSRFRFVTLFTYLISQLSLYRALSKANLPVDAKIYINTLLPFGAALWGYRSGRKVIYHVHEVSIKPALLRNFLIYVVEKCASHVFYVSEDQRKRLPISSVPTAILPNPIPQEVAEVGLDILYSPRRSGCFEVLMLASPRNFKGVPEFFEIARRFVDSDDVRFTLVLNADFKEIEAYISASDCPVNVTIHSRTNTPSTYYATADVLLNLSRVDQWIETFGMTIVEGMAFGLPVIVPPVGGPVEIVTDGREGYLVDSRDIDRIEWILRCLAQDGARAMEMSRFSRNRAKDYTMSEFKNSITRELSHFLNNSRTRSGLI